jgi:SAM-dependent methyltransferase
MNLRNASGMGDRLVMKTIESGMPPEEMWNGFFDPHAILQKLKLTDQCDGILEFGCGYGTFTIPAAQTCRGTVYALDIDDEMLAATETKVKTAELHNVDVQKRDFVTEGSGLDEGSVDYVMLFNILHADERLVLLNEAKRVLRDNGILAVIHWNFDPSTPRGPSMGIRPRPNDCRTWAESVGFTMHPTGCIDLPPYHYGFVFQK